MSSSELCLRLNQLIQTDVDAVHAYEQAISAVDEAEVRRQLDAFRSDHLSHIATLSELVRDLGGTPPQARDSLGVMIEGFTALSGLLGTTAVLTAMRSNEEVTNAAYERASRLELPPEAEAAVSRGLADERRHRDWIAARLRG